MKTHWFATDRPLSFEEITQKVPAVCVTHPAGHLSPRYGFVSTEKIARALIANGFYCVGAIKARVRKAEREGFQKHALQFTYQKFQQWNVAGDTGDLRVVIQNSHDGGGAYVGSLGFYRHACLNSLVVGLSFGEFRVRHHQHAADEVLEATYRILEDVPRLQDTIERWSHVTLSLEQQQEFAARALGLRWGPEAAPFGSERLLEYRRPKDASPDLWRVFNRVQENLIKGGQSYRVVKAGEIQYRHVRALTAPKPVIDLNRRLWDLAETYAKV